MSDFKIQKIETVLLVSYNWRLDPMKGICGHSAKLKHRFNRIESPFFLLFEVCISNKQQKGTLFGLLAAEILNFRALKETIEVKNLALLK